MKQYKTIFFDLDHTLWDFESNSMATLQHIYTQFDLQKLGIENFESFYQSYKEHNERLWDRYRKGFIKRDELKWKRMWLCLLDFKIANESLAKEVAIVFIEMLPQQTALFPHAIQCLDYCKAKGYDMNLITNGFEDTQWKKIDACGIGHYFSHVITSEKSNSIKPNREIFEYAVALAETNISESLMVGDNYDVDIEGAKNVGMDQVYFNPEAIAHRFETTYEISSLHQLMDII